MVKKDLNDCLISFFFLGKKSSMIVFLMLFSWNASNVHTGVYPNHKHQTYSY